MNDERYEQLVEASWRRPLTPDEESELQLHLASNPELQEQWDVEQALAHGLHRLPDAPLSSNFTSQVLQAIDREGKAATNRGWFVRAWFRSWLPRLASIGAAAALVVFFGVHKYQVHTRTEAMSHVASFSPFVAAVPSPDVWENFDSIQQLNGAPTYSDEDLVAVLLK